MGRTAVIVAVLALALPGAARPGEAAHGEGDARRPVSLAYLYDVAALDGPIAMSWATLGYDAARRELYVIAPGEGVRVFNRTGVEVYRFGDEGQLGWVRGVAVIESGDLLLLSERDGTRVLRTDFRGRQTGELRLEVPKTLGDFAPSRLAYRDGLVYLADTSRLKLLVTDLKGATVRAVDLAPLALGGAAPDGNQMHGFSVDPRGNVLFTIPTEFHAYILAPDGTLRVFGRRGSRPGMFNVVGPIVADEQGTVFVADQLRRVVMVFGPDLEFVGESGGGEAGLVIPSEMAVGNGVLFVSQGGNRGVSAFLVHGR
ncbi:NHL repeat domain protein [Anaeromyxobacter dehalogenans 2CP-1]|uniref:NHL repeat domain protein n=1 Tax=Anaeromyxobacter dehalogenans (strain ATCC BAA-258 / DSM 21875 / 2CP-1) TaxID=455488 RepID=B8JGV5_ANAD2|nr:hypothetical protein [Anaeromyxobacter dehalogenans]ACL66592.1 NHL repeat domain protein [Anaeromyxobacter dehalogenans 2CP-1]